MLESVTLDGGSTILFDLSGAESPVIETGTLTLGECGLNLSYADNGSTNLHTLISANASDGSTFHGLPEGAWLYAGPPDDLNEFTVTYSGNGRRDVVLENFGRFEPPRLRVAHGPEDQLTVAWPLSALGYRLERTPSLSAPEWNGDDGLEIFTSETERFAVEDSVTNRFFYRLRR
jgi:hypothetical protein